VLSVQAEYQEMPRSEAIEIAGFGIRQQYRVGIVEKKAHTAVHRQLSSYLISNTSTTFIDKI
jgi:hypothetical protein